MSKCVWQSSCVSELRLHSGSVQTFWGLKERWVPSKAKRRGAWLTRRLSKTGTAKASVWQLLQWAWCPMCTPWTSPSCPSRISSPMPRVWSCWVFRCWPITCGLTQKPPFPCCKKGGCLSLFARFHSVLWEPLPGLSVCGPVGRHLYGRMDEWVDESMDLSVSEWMNDLINQSIHQWRKKQTSEWLVEWMNEWMKEQTNKWMSEWVMSEWVSDWVSGCTNAWVDACMNEWPLVLTWRSYAMRHGMSCLQWPRPWLF